MSIFISNSYSTVLPLYLFSAAKLAEHKNLSSNEAFSVSVQLYMTSCSSIGGILMSFRLEFSGWTDGREMELQPSAPGFFHPYAVLIPNGDGLRATAAPNEAKRAREAVGAPAAMTPMDHSRSDKI
ncbi:hypothetical protein ZIOFF_001965 [Zingiber officinale]|uniref:Uncharacterized protein n=1 Tax=Zingiber officinale TaxID=94328 RepID=A0A8J5I6C3_ZINOF|nr:hypothetical protein ZIOFF_001960 [Zingiber officinale]KAG6536889.1 hypothetical protein ZIOFF_001965 [Zingiber officinale]